MKPTFAARMTIAVNTTALQDEYNGSDSNFLYETFRLLTKNYPQHQFVFIGADGIQDHFMAAGNVKTIIIRIPKQTSLSLKIWYGLRLPAAVKRIKPDIFISCKGACALKTGTPQYLIVNDLFFLHDAHGMKKGVASFYKKNMANFAGRSTKVITFSNYIKNELITQFNIPAGKVDVMPVLLKDIFQPVTEEIKRNIKNTYTQGAEYFVYTGGIHPAKNLVNLLKAFSLFKKRQQTGMKLVITGDPVAGYSSFTENLKTYKYRQDVVMTGEVKEEELVKITGAAYAMIHPSAVEGHAEKILEAMGLQVPCITGENGALQETAQEAALYAGVTDPQQMADQMMRIYKDENLRRELIEKGKKIVETYKQDHAMKTAWRLVFDKEQDHQSN